MLDTLRRVLEAEPDIAYGLVSGSGARGTAHANSDIDVAIELRASAPRQVLSLGALAARRESATGRPIDLGLLDEAPISLAYRIFRDGHLFAGARSR
jgi:predicted nucleotidyltransferase